MDYVPQPKYERDKIRPTADEGKSQWVTLHNDKQYLLPIVSRYQTIVPTFDQDGSVSVKIKAKDDQLTPLVDSFFDLVASYNKAERTIVFAADEIFTDFFALMQRLLLTNYDYTTDELNQLLTVNHEQLRHLFEALFKHLLRQ